MTPSEYKELAVILMTLADMDLALRNLEDNQTVPSQFRPQVSNITSRVIALQADLTRYTHEKALED